MIDGSKAWEQYDNGNENFDTMMYGYYLGNIHGIRLAVNGILFCTPKDSKDNQLAAVVRKYIKNNPEKWNEGAWNLIFIPLKEAFPCKKK